MRPAWASINERLQAHMAAARAEAPLTRWMMEHRAEVKAMLRGGQMDWHAAGQASAAHGLKDYRGKLPDAVTAEDTWRQANKPGRPKR